MLQIRDISKRFLDRHLFKECSLLVDEGERVALIGSNGTGKTTLFRMITGDEPWDSGELVLKSGTTVGFLPQEMGSMGGSTVLHEVMRSSTEVEDLQKEMQELEGELAGAEGSHQKQLLRDYGRAQSRFEQLGGYGVEHQARKVLVGLGFKETDLSRKASEFSGGWQIRMAVAKLLLDPPGIMLLDEPTNHLDLQSLLWLQDYLLSGARTVIFASHDRDFIDRVSTRIVDIDEGSLVTYRGKYDYYVEEKKKRAEVLDATRRRQEQKIKQARRFIERFRAVDSRARLVQSKIKALEKMEQVELPAQQKTMRLKFPQPERSGRDVVSLQGVDKSYGDNRIYSGLDLTVLRGERIAMVGPNGAGKSTLLRILAGELDIDSGSRTVGHNVRVAYYPQHRLDLLNPLNTCLGEIEQVYHNGRQTEMRGLLGSFLFSGDDAEKQVAVLSGGEKSRLLLARILADPPNLLLMDEPINHLDIPSRDVLIEALNEFSGTLCFISHDTHFIRRVANKVIEIVDGTLKTYSGDFDHYVYRKEINQDAGARSDGPGGGRKAKPARKTSKKDERRRKAQDRKDTRELHREPLEKVEAELEECSSRLDELNEALSGTAVYQDGSVVSLIREHKELSARIAGLTVEWERRVETLPGADGDSRASTQ